MLPCTMQQRHASSMMNTLPVAAALILACTAAIAGTARTPYTIPRMYLLAMQWCYAAWLPGWHGQHVHSRMYVSQDLGFCWQLAHLPAPEASPGAPACSCPGARPCTSGSPGARHLALAYPSCAITTAGSLQCCMGPAACPAASTTSLNQHHTALFSSAVCTQHLQAKSCCAV